jgi:hypothetical protein
LGPGFSEPSLSRWGRFLISGEPRKETLNALSRNEQRQQHAEYDAPPHDIMSRLTRGIEG